MAGGGEGSVFGIQGQPQFVAKIYKENRRTSEREQKLCHMIQYRLTPDQLKQITWPQDVLYDENGFAGYVMPRLDKTDSLVSIYSNGFDNKYDIRYRVLAAINLCVALKTVHEMGQVCGDLNPQNICINLDTTDAVNGFHVTLVDTDSYHFTAEGKTYRCEVGLGDYIAPELQNKMAQGYDLKNVPLPSYTKETDLFALAVHIFTLLMNGCHPFACAKENNVKVSDIAQIQETSFRDSVVAPQPIENIKNGFFPFFDKKDGITTPIYAPAFQYLPEEIQVLFIRTFVEGYEDPSKRVTEDEWIAALKNTKFVKRECGANEAKKVHYFFEHNVVCPICATQERIVKLFGGAPVAPPTPPPEIKISESEQKIWKSPVKEKRKPIAAFLLMLLISLMTLIRANGDVVLTDNNMLLLYSVFMITGAVGICADNKKGIWIWFSLIAGISVWLSFSPGILTIICNVDLLFIWFGIQIHQNEKKSKTSNPKYWWLPGVLSIVMVYGQHYYEIVNMYSVTEEYIKEITIALMKVALFFVLGYWMAYPYKKNK
ncbi:MAG: hypothetical protein V8R67_01565 [Eubacterium sp.]